MVFSNGAFTPIAACLTSLNSFLAPLCIILPCCARTRAIIRIQLSHLTVLRATWLSFLFKSVSWLGEGESRRRSWGDCRERMVFKERVLRFSSVTHCGVPKLLGFHREVCWLVEKSPIFLDNALRINQFWMIFSTENLIILINLSLSLFIFLGRSWAWFSDGLNLWVGFI